jgi:hypothetical protein
VIVIVDVPGVGFGEGEGEGEGDEVGEAGVELPPPHPRAVTSSAAMQNDEATSRIRLRAGDRAAIRRTFSKY